MKKLKMIYLWILISVILQALVLSYVNFVYLPGRGKVKTTMYEEEAASIKNRSMKLPEKAQDISVSFDGLYVAYKLDDELVIVDIDRKKTVKKLNPGDGSFSYFRWLPDREMLIYATKEPEGERGKVLLSTYDIGPELERSYPVIKNLPEGSEVVDIELSPLTNIVYPMIKTSDTRARIYKFDIMDNLTSIMKVDLSTKIMETMYTDSLVYQTSDGKIRIRYGKTGKTGSVPVKESELLLAVDDYDYIYTGATDENGRLTAIYSGKSGQTSEEWKTIELGQPTAPEDLFITAEGGLFTADQQGKTVQALKSTRKAEYQGELLTVLESYVVSMEDGKLILKILE